MSAEFKACAQCGWDISLNAPPSTNPGDTKARIGVAAGLVVAYGVLTFLIQGTPSVARAAAPAAPRHVAAAEVTPEPVFEPATAIGTLPPAVASVPAGATNPSALITIKVADNKAAHIKALDALEYAFALPETDQTCKLLGSTKGVSGYARNIEVFLLTDDEYVFWHANPAAIAQSSWETRRGSENTLSYDLPGAGNYHFIISNNMSAAPSTITVKAQVKCVH